MLFGFFWHQACGLVKHDQGCTLIDLYSSLTLKKNGTLADVSISLPSCLEHIPAVAGN
jgi:hypothetical protein